MDGLEARSADGSGRRARKKERTRAQIYAAAMELFVARGYDAVTIEEICDAADVARGTFFLHYPSKDSLLGEYGRQASAELVSLLEAHEGSASEALEEGLRFLAERATRLASVVRLVVRESAARPTAITDTTASGRDLSEIFAQVILRGQHAGEFRKRVDPLVAGAILSSSYLVIAGAWARHEDAPALTELTRQALDVVLRGLAQPDRTPRRKS
jgi:TetR/AcrR family transcriptional regulator, cholesterol catabolism regulator